MSGEATGSNQSVGEPPSVTRHGPAGVLGQLFGQFGRPSGLLGHLAGVLMARSTADDQWVVELLDVQPDDRVLEVGFGPGVAVTLLAERARVGFVAGVDPSEVMLRQAVRRNRAAVRAGRVELRLGTVSALPYPDAHFTKACAIHSLYFWPSVEAGLRELHRVLAPGGLLALAVRMQRPQAGRFNPSRYGFTDEQVAAVVATLSLIGFRDVSTQRKAFRGETLAAILARR